MYADYESVKKYVEQNFIHKDEHQRILNSGRVMYEAGRNDYKVSLVEWLKEQKSKVEYGAEDIQEYQKGHNETIQSVIEYVEL